MEFQAIIVSVQKDFVVLLCVYYLWEQKDLWNVAISIDELDIHLLLFKGYMLLNLMT